VRAGGPINPQTRDDLEQAVAQPFVAQLEPFGNIGPYSAYQQQ